MGPLAIAVGIKVKETVEQASAEWIVETERILPSDNVKFTEKCILTIKSYIRV